MKNFLYLLVVCLGLAACDADKPATDSPDSPESDKTEATEPAAAEKGEEQHFDALKDASCNEFYEYSREVCLKSLRTGLDRSCFMVFNKAVSTQKIMAGESMAKQTAKLSDDQKRESFCGRPYKKLAERVAEAGTKERTYPEECKAVVNAIDEQCLKPMSEGKEGTGACSTALQTISKWESGAKFCQVTLNILEG